MDNNKLDNKQIIFKGISLVLGIFMIAVCYNMFFVPNEFVVGGSSGLAIIIEGLTGYDSKVFVYLISITLVICSYIFLGKEETKNTIIGSLLFPLFVTLTNPIVNVIGKTFQFEEILVTVIFAALLYGFGTGIVYKCGFNTGGIDVLVKICHKYFHIQEGKAMLILNGTLILFGGFVFGIDKVAYSISIIVISTIILDKILIGISDTKLFLVYTRKLRDVKKIINNFNTGYTLLPTIGGYSHKKGTLIMSAVSTRDYVKFKEAILEVDPSAFFIINDCYEVNGGVKRSNLPFI